MALPTAVRRNAEKARQSVAAINGQPTAQAPQRGGGDYLDVPASTPSPVSNAAVAPVQAPTLKAQQDEQSRNPPATHQPNGETYRPHALADVTGETGNVNANLPPARAANGALSEQSDTAIPSTTNASAQHPDFVDPEDWKARYATLRVSRNERADALEREVNELRSVNRTLSDRIMNLTREDEKTASRFELDEATRERLGKDQAEVFDRLNQSVEQRFEQQESERKAQATASMERFESDLESLVPRWFEMNTDRRFLSWLNEADETGVRRQDTLNRFVEDRDATSVAAMFRSFAVSGGQAEQRNGHQPSPEMTAARAGSGLGAEEVMEEVWDQSEIAAFYQAKNRLYQAGKLKGERLQQVMAEEARIRKAMAENRVDMTR